MKRTISRIKVLFMLYQYDLCNKEVNLDSFDELLIESKNEMDNCEYDPDFTNNLYQKVIDNIDTIDRIIAINLDNYLIERLSYIDRNILRIGTCELLYTNTPKNVIINEVINMSKDYSETEDYKTSKFNNAVIDKIAKFIKERKQNGGN